MRLISLAVCLLFALPARAATQQQTGPDALSGQHAGPADALLPGNRRGAALRTALDVGATYDPRASSRVKQ